MTEPPTHIEDEQRRIAALVRALDEPAPESLHRRVEALVDARQKGRPFAWRPGRRRRPFSRALGLAGAGALLVAVAVVLVAIVVGLGGGGDAHTMSLGQAAAPTLRAATLPAPSESPAHRTQLAMAVDGVPFPYWEERFGWRTTGARGDRIDGRTVMTVFYADAAGRRIGYAILAGAPPRIGGGGGVVAWRGGVRYRMLTAHDVPMVTWLRDGHLCVVSGRGVSGATLLALASWSDRDATTS